MDGEQDVGTATKRVRWEGPSDSQEESERDPPNLDSIGPTKVALYCATRFHFCSFLAIIQICLTAFCQQGRLGCAYYDPIKCVIYVLEDTQEGVHHDLTTMLLEHSSPDVILTSSKADDAFITVLQNHAEASGSIFQIRPHKEFVPRKGRDRLLSLRLLSELDCDVDPNHDSSSDIPSTTGIRNAYDFMQKRRVVTGDPTMKRWNAAIRLANFASLESAPLCLSSIGALLDFLSRERAAGEVDDDGPGALDICGIEALTLDEVMHINADALFSLQVFERENHASIHSDKTKEGLSLFGLNTEHYADCIGRSLLRTWFIRPSLSLEILKARHDAVECFLCPENLPVVTPLQTHLKGKGTISDWQALVKFTYHSSMLRDALAELHQGGHVEIVLKVKPLSWSDRRSSDIHNLQLVRVLDVGEFKEVGNIVNDTVGALFLGNMSQVLTLMSRQIDWEESAEAGRVCVRPHVDEELDKRKHIYRGIDSVLSKVAEQISQTVPADYAESLNVVYFPQLGFLITVPMLEEWESEAGVQVLDGWNFQVISCRSHVYFKSKEMQDMDNHIGDLHPAIVDREIEIVQELLEEVLVHDKAIVDACDVCAELDCLLSFAEAARAFDYRRPEMVEEPVIDIIQGRHPLQEQIVDAFVPNDVRLVSGVGLGQSYVNESNSDVDGGSSIVICTGANACGKSVYLKQVALIQYMAQVHSMRGAAVFVPAESATLGIVDKIFTRIQTRESVSKVQSAFMIDLNQVSFALRNCTSRSLILLDEFGKGTLSTDGAGLFCGVVKHLLDRGRDCPKVLAASHFHDVFRKDLLDPHKLPIAFLHMQVLFASNTGEVLDTDGILTSPSRSEHNVSRGLAPGEKITYLYRVAPGLSLCSHAAQCAAMFGLPRRIVSRAQYVSELLAEQELGKLLEEQMTIEERLDLQAAEEVARRFLEWDLTSDEAVHQSGVKARLAKVLGRNVGSD
ncbi:muts domain V-domain-containing protein [Melanogaster broomeanus]|nr:muts domain V-domain-containing protein [Melanogaster broomeanus]